MGLVPGAHFQDILLQKIFLCNTLPSDQVSKSHLLYLTQNFKQLVFLNTWLDEWWCKNLSLIRFSYKFSNGQHGKKVGTKKLQKLE